MVGGSYRAGDTTWYDFHFKTEILLESGSWMRFTFPDNDFGIGARPECYSKPLFGVEIKGDLTCTNDNGEVKVEGISESILPGTYVLIRVEVTNPTTAITSGTFTIETGLRGTNTVFEYVK